MTDRVEAKVRATCDVCGTVEVPIADARLEIGGVADRSDSRSVVSFSCPVCGRSCAKSIDERTERLLVSAGVELVASTGPAPQHGAGDPGDVRRAPKK